MLIGMLINFSCFVQLSLALEGIICMITTLFVFQF
jgi:hypothetical protein